MTVFKLFSKASLCVMISIFGSGADNVYAAEESLLMPESVKKGPIEETYYVYKDFVKENSEMDMGALNQRMNWKEALIGLESIDSNLYQSQPNILYSDVIKGIADLDILSTLDPVQIRAFFKGTDELRSYLTLKAEERGEIGYDVERLLSRIWSLSIREDLFKPISSSALIFDTGSAVNLLINSLSNATDVKFDYQWYAGRLALNYLQLLYSLTYEFKSMSEKVLDNSFEEYYNSSDEEDQAYLLVDDVSDVEECE